MRKLTFIFFVALSVVSLSCEDEANDPIVINTGGDNDDDNTDDGGDGDDGNNGDNTGGGTCVFTEIEASFTNCVEPTNEDKLEVVTWNIEQFPNSGSTTLEAVEAIIANTNADVIALQEIVGIAEMNTVAEQLEDWEVKILDISGSLNMGYLYKTCEISSFSNPTNVSVIEPRPAVKTTITHNNGLEVVLFNIHLKCCGGSDNISRRETASRNLKTYIDDNHASDNVIVLGDFNDDIDSGSPFTNFISDNANYQFADEAIADGSSSNWSYPSWPSHIDHILISDELFDNLEETRTIKLASCVTSYSSTVSDHRPVISVFKAD